MKMKIKLTFLAITFTLFYSFSNAQTYTSVGNSSWLSPTTWSPVGVPILGVNATVVIINSNVVLDTSYVYSSGSITINSGKSLQESGIRTMLLNGSNAIFTNNGTFTFSNFIANNGGATNNGSMNIDIVLYNNAVFLNNGTITGIDSFLNNKTFTNTSIASLGVNQFQNDKTVRNFGTITAVDHLNNDSLTNKGRLIFTNFSNASNCLNDSLITINDFTNTGSIFNNKVIIGNNDFTNRGSFQNAGTYTVGHDFLNHNLVTFDAVFANNGLVTVGHNWWNADTIKGTVLGSFVVQDSTANTGSMKGTFDFCDLTPPATAIKIDLNTGTVTPGITYCTHVAIENIAKSNINIYPNPANNFITIELLGSSTKNSIIISNNLGQTIYNSTFIEKAYIDISKFSTGVYFLKIQSKEFLISEKIIKQ